MSFVIEPGVVIAGRYRLESPIAEGGYGLVWKALQIDLGRDVAIKILKPATDDTSRARFEREAKALARLNHANCVKLFSSGHLPDGRAYLVTEYLFGRTLYEWITVDRPIAVVVSLAEQLASVLTYAHAQRIVHRDLKPTNVMLTDNYGELRVKVLDFGIARILGDEHATVTKTGEVFGTFGYMSPEQLRGERDVGPAADVYALGVLLFEMLEGRALFDAEHPIDLAQLHLSQPAPALRRQVPSDLRHLVARLLEKDPRDRPRAADAHDALLLLNALEGGRTMEEVTAPELEPTIQQTVHARPLRPSGLKRSTVTAGVVLILTVGVLAAIVTVIALDEPRPTTERTPPILPTAPLAVAPRVADAASGVIDEAPDAAVSSATPDTSGLAAGCESHLDFGPGTHRFTKGLRTPITVHLPESYDRTRRMPAAVIFHDGLQDGGRVLHLTGFKPLAERDGYILLAPHDTNRSATWKRQAVRAATWESLRDVQEILCIDPDRITGVGYGEGGAILAKLPCAMKTRAVVSMSYRRGDAEVTCKPEPATPRLFLAPMRDPYAPSSKRTPLDDRNSVTNCLKEKKWSLSRQIDHLRELNDCTEDRQLTRKHGRSACFTYECKTGLVLCELDGARPWPGMPTNPFCGGDAANFPVTEMAWEFLISNNKPQR